MPDEMQTNKDTQVRTKMNVTPVGRYRALFLATVLISLGLTVIYDSALIQAIAYGIGLAWVIFENWVIFKAVLGVQRMLIFLSKPKTDEVSDEKS